MKNYNKIRYDMNQLDDWPFESSPKKYFLPYSIYQIVLFFFDIFIITSSLYLSFFKIFSTKNYYSVIDTISLLILAIPIISFIPMYKLYSYHVIFRKKPHMITLSKAFLWSLSSLIIIYILYDWPLIFSGSKFYNAVLLLAVAFLMAIFGRLFATYLTNLLMVMGVAFITVGLLGLIIGNNYPIFLKNTWITVISIMIAMIMTFIERYIVVHVVYNKWLRRFFRRQMVIIGINEFTQDIIKHIVSSNAPFWVSGLVTIKNENALKKEKTNLIFNKKELGSIDSLPKIVNELNIKELIITDLSINKRKLIRLLDFAVTKGVVVWFPPLLLPVIPMKLNIDNFCGIPMIRMCVQRNPNFFKVFKRCVDFILASIILVLFSPLLVLIGVAIKLDSKGPIFYKAKMVGENGKFFKMYKFRSMRVDGDHNIHKNFVTKFIKGEITQEKRRVLKITDDPRVTRVGKLIRRLSLDELPQLFNVIKGDMSLVGPRPCLPYEYELYKDWHRKRNSVKPGITGLWQIAGRSEVSFEEMILLDLYYIYNRNLFMDLSILFETIFVVIGMEGAY